MLPPGALAVWNTGSTAPSINVTDTGVYEVTVTQDRCVGRDFIHISTRLCDCITGMPNAFSPNGDGLNDIFRPAIESGCPVRGYLFRIFNRWGQLIFSTTTPGSGWDGFIKGLPAESGNYIFTLSYEKGTEHHRYSIKGDVTLIR